MEIIIIKTLQLVLCFSILILLHEGGHFFFAKLFKVRVEKFALFFDPWFTLFKFRPKNSDTTYALGWLPLGGYVKISGMIDESLDKEQLKAPVQSWEFRAKPAWQRLLIMLGGVIVNFLLALFIYAMILFANGDSYTPLQNMTHGMKFNETAQQYGFRDGDILLTADGDTLRRFDSNNAVGDVYRAISQARQVEVLRDGAKVQIALPGNISMLDMIQELPPFVSVLLPSVVDSVVEGSVAMKAGLMAGDKVVSLNNSEISTWNEYNASLYAIKKAIEASPTDSIRLSCISLVVERASTNSLDTLEVQLGGDLKLPGMIIQNSGSTYDKVTKTYSFLSSLPAGVSYGWGVMKGYVNDLKYLFSKDGAKNVGSFITIGNLFPDTWDWTKFWQMTAFISLILAVMNVLPIPALDGGHVLFLLYEIITRRAPSEKFMEYAQMAGMAFLFLLMALAIFNDVLRYVV